MSLKPKLSSTKKKNISKPWVSPKVFLPHEVKAGDLLRPVVLITGKNIPVSEHYNPNWILLKDQPKLEQYQKKHSNIMWHGTTDLYLEGIKRYGLTPSQKAGLGATGSSAWHGREDDQIGSVAITDHMPNAVGYALHAGILSEREGNQLVLMIDKTKLSQKDIWLREGSGAPPAKEWDYTNFITPETIIGYWHNIGKVKIIPGQKAFIEESKGRHKGWVFFSNPAYKGELGP